MNRRVQQCCAWSGPLLVVLAGAGLAGFARLIPANTPKESASRIVHMYAHHATGVRIGMALAMFAMGLIIPWGVSLATQTRRAAPEHPILFHIQVACSVGGTMLGVMFVILGALAAFRAGHIAHSTTQMLNDAMWFCWVFPGSYFIVWNCVVGASILLDKHREPIFPRWAGYVSIWAGISYFPGFLGIFFKSGAFSYNGLFVWWIPTVAFFGWIVLMSVLTLRAINQPPETSADALGQIKDAAVVAEFARLRAELADRIPA
jgi:hypothetical protein